VLDVGCNTGHFSLLAGKQGARVVAVDADPVAVGRAFEAAEAAHLDVLPLVVNIARPVPALGWRNRECPSFLDRARGRFDMVLLLAVLHHLFVSERIPMPEVLELVSELTNSWAVIEFVGPEDEMFRRIASGREGLFVDLTQATFETACRRWFEVVRCESVPNGHRWLYLLRKKAS
jgi:ribosomal protein L11 methylase PrmA